MLLDTIDRALVNELWLIKSSNHFITTKEFLNALYQIEGFIPNDHYNLSKQMAPLVTNRLAN
jgi:hypothetical protein